MLVAVHARARRPGPEALISGLRAIGLQHRVKANLTGVTNVIPGATHAIIENRRGPNAVIYDHYRDLGVDVWILELPRLRMNCPRDQNLHALTHGLYRNTLHYMPTFVGNTAYVYGTLKGRKPKDRYVLVCGQKQGDTSHGMDAPAMARWTRDAVALARQYGLPICYRPHPRAETGLRGELFGADHYSDPAKETMREALKRADAVVVHNSSAGVDAIDAGVPVLYTANPAECAYYQYAQPLGSPIRQLSAAERETCLLRLAACQWTQDQLRDGTALRVSLLGEAPPPAELVVMTDSARETTQAEVLTLAKTYEQLAGAGQWL
jgi:hypothetical protein